MMITSRKILRPVSLAHLNLCTNHFIANKIGISHVDTNYPTR